MTDDPRIPDGTRPDDQLPSDDELVSAVLDGEASAEERARVAADPELTARLEVFRQVREAVAEPVAPLDEVSSRRLLDRALDEVAPRAVHGSAGAAPTGSRPGADPAVARRSRWIGRGAAAGAAAAIALIAFAGGRAVLEDGEAADQVASTAGESYESISDLADDDAEMAPFAAGGTADAPADGAADHHEDAGGSALPLDARAGLAHHHVGEFGSPHEFADAARAAAHPAPTSTIAADSGADAETPDEGQAHSLGPPCPTAVDEALALVGSPLGIADGTVQGRAVLAVVPTDRTQPVVVVSVDDCSVSLVD